MANSLHSAIEDRPLSHEARAWRWKILISTYCAYAGFYLVRKVFTNCKPTIAKEFHFDYVEIANIWAAYLVAYMVGQFINSFIGRKWGPRVLLLGGLGFSIAINVVFSFTTSYHTFLVFMIFNGLVQAAGWPGSVGAVAEWLKQKERGFIMGFWSTNYLVGDIAVKMITGFLLLRFSTTVDDKGQFVADRNGVRFAFLGCTLLAFAIWWLVFFWQRSKPEDVGLEPIVDHDHVAGRSITTSTRKRLGVAGYFRLLFNPIVPLMGLSYFTIKFLRYGIDSWLTTFLAFQGMSNDMGAYFSIPFNVAGVIGAVLAGYAVDRVFRGRWEIVCLLMGLGLIPSYLAVLHFGANPYTLAFCYALVGFMLYGPDTLLSGAASVTVAGQRNGVAVAGLVNGIASCGPILQEPIIGRILANKPPAFVVHLFEWIGLGDVFSKIPVKDTPEFNAFAIRFFNQIGLGMSVAYFVLMLIISVSVARIHKRARLEPAVEARPALETK